MRQFHIDDQITEWVVDSRHEPLTSMMHMVTVFGDTLTLTLVCIGVFVIAWLANRIDLAAMIVVGSLSGYVLMRILKLVFSRDRPPIDDRLIDVGGSSFPSGHAMLGTIVFGLTAVVVFRVYPRVRERAAALLWLPILVLLIGVSRVYLGVHWASDVLFGWVFGVVWLGVCLFGHTQIVRRPALLRMGTKHVTTPGRPSAAQRGDQGTSSPS
ncbi:phosphatase PAP2 family protein [Gordonia hydrophobica]|uniref:Phosphatase PAP2 family protein n=1 Tax=Gordonia hydrophobica TaxID=40516 RepID=A0ABZ2U3Q1_9ACTN|nr:phosphatase PAP2 family protein [Gordonia hydrophobica]MBM7367489.1 undecaprenyl-diphosphatase [Gordonia hydrophobica]